MSRKLRHRSHHGHSDAPSPETHDQEVELLAYQYWKERGSPFGSPEEDWYKAEEHLEKQEQAAARL